MKHSDDGIYAGQTYVSLGLDGIGDIVFIVFLILKLTGTTDLSWFWVFFPLWIVPAVVFGLLLIFLVAFIGVAGLKKLFSNTKHK